MGRWRKVSRTYRTSGQDIRKTERARRRVERAVKGARIASVGIVQLWDMADPAEDRMVASMGRIGG
jgi:hypothetical protein